MKLQNIPKEEMLSIMGRLAGQIARGKIKSPSKIIKQIREMISVAVYSGVSVDELTKACTCYGNSQSIRSLFHFSLQSLCDITNSEAERRLALEIYSL